MKGAIAKAALYWRTVRRLKPSQAVWRARYTLRRRLGLFPRIPLPQEAPAFGEGCLDSLRLFAQCWARHGTPDPGSIDTLRQGRITFLNHTVDGSNGLPWRQDALPRLWRYHLHSFEYARRLALENPEAPCPEDGKRALDWIQDWIARNPPGTDVAWDAFPIAARLMNWALAAAVFGFDDASMRRSFQQQTEYLLRSLEYDLLANHLLQNAAGLVVAGNLLGEGEPLARGMAILEEQTLEQLLPDGGHFERSPMYHCQVLEHLLMAYAAFEARPEFLGRAIITMCDFLDAICHPDGDIPLFGDAALRTTASPKTLTALARELTGSYAREAPAGTYALEASGFYVLGPEDRSARLIAKAGPPGPDYQLGHAHCDALSYEFTVGTQRVIVDSGVHGYADSPWRGYCRSTRAHNTVSVNGREQMECWAVFRVARRYTPVRHAWGEDEAGWILEAGHDGFRPFQHNRRFLFHREGFWVIVDTVTSTPRRACGPGRIEAESYIHVHPALEVMEEAGAWALRGAGIHVAIVPFGASGQAVVSGASAPQQGWYCPEFGKAVPAPVVVLRKCGTSRVRFGYAIFPCASTALSATELHAIVDEQEPQ